MIIDKGVGIQYIKDIILKNISELCKEENKKELWMIIYKNKIFKTNTGKATWSKIGYAKSAFRNAVVPWYGGSNFSSSSLQEECIEAAYKEVLQDVSFINIFKELNNE